MPAHPHLAPAPTDAPHKLCWRESRRGPQASQLFFALAHLLRCFKIDDGVSWNHHRRTPMKWLMRLFVSSMLMVSLVLSAHAQLPSRSEDVPPRARSVPFTHTLAICGQPSCDCGTSRLVAQEYGPCRVTSSTGDCYSGTGQCCVCQARKTVAICAEATCDCGNSELLSQANAPCQVSSTTGQCSIGSGQCCVCALP
jgi:hypothetical protein